MSLRLSELILSINDEYIVLNKPSGLLSIPDREGKDPSLKLMLKEQYGDIFTVHRIDRDTSGIIVFARTEAMHKHLSQQFEGRETTKIYNGLVMGQPAQPSGVINEPIIEHPVKKGHDDRIPQGKGKHHRVQSGCFFPVL
jgi:23S rRNA pseudouridine1911/1915/1917 synthase